MDSRYKVLRLLDAEPERIEGQMNQMDREGYRFVQMETVYGRSKGAMLTVLVFEKERTEEDEIEWQEFVAVRDDAIMLVGLDAPDDGVPIGDPLLEGLRR